MRIALVVCGAIPLLFVHSAWGNPTLVVYSITAVLFGILLVGEYPKFGTRSFWCAMPLILGMHVAIALGLAVVVIEFSNVVKLPRILFGFLGLIAFAEWWVAIRIVEICEPRKN